MMEVDVGVFPLQLVVDFNAISLLAAFAQDCYDPRLASGCWEPDDTLFEMFYINYRLRVEIRGFSVCVPTCGMRLGKSLKPLKPRQRLSPLRLCHYYHLRRDSPRRRTPESLPNPDPNPDCGLTEFLVYSGSFLQAPCWRCGDFIGSLYESACDSNPTGTGKLP